MLKSSLRLLVICAISFIGYNANANIIPIDASNNGICMVELNEETKSLAGLDDDLETNIILNSWINNHKFSRYNDSIFTLITDENIPNLLRTPQWQLAPPNVLYATLDNDINDAIRSLQNTPPLELHQLNSTQDIFPLLNNTNDNHAKTYKSQIYLAIKPYTENYTNFVKHINSNIC